MTTVNISDAKNDVPRTVKNMTAGSMISKFMTNFGEKLEKVNEKPPKDKRPTYRCRCCSNLMTEPVLFVGDFWEKPHLVLYMRENKHIIDGEK
jgi:hypothetical protein